VGWEIGFDTNWDRDIGYGVPAYCDHPDCNEEIDRGLAYVCGGEPYGGDAGCGLYFCENHHSHYRDADDDNDESHSLCERCAKGLDPFDPKPEHPRWLAWKETDESWAEWRKERDESLTGNQANE
jgi:hypothetical protein